MSVIEIYFTLQDFHLGSVWFDEYEMRNYADNEPQKFEQYFSSRKAPTS